MPRYDSRVSTFDEKAKRKVEEALMSYGELTHNQRLAITQAIKIAFDTLEEEIARTLQDHLDLDS